MSQDPNDLFSRNVGDPKKAPVQTLLNSPMKLELRIECRVAHVELHLIKRREEARK